MTHFSHFIRQYGSILVSLAAKVCKQAQVPVALHLDHEQDEEQVKLAATLPFDSIMIDMSHYVIEENLRKTRDLAELL